MRWTKQYTANDGDATATITESWYGWRWEVICGGSSSGGSDEDLDSAKRTAEHELARLRRLVGFAFGGRTQ